MQDMQTECNNDHTRKYVLNYINDDVELLFPYSAERGSELEKAEEYYFCHLYLICIAILFESSNSWYRNE